MTLLFDSSHTAKRGVSGVPAVRARVRTALGLLTVDDMGTCRRRVRAAQAIRPRLWPERAPVWEGVAAMPEDLALVGGACRAKDILTMDIAADRELFHSER